MKYFRDLGILCASGQKTVFVKDHCPLLQTNSILIEILMLGKVGHFITITHATHFLCSYRWAREY